MKQSDNLSVLGSLVDGDIKGDLKCSVRTLTDVTPLFPGKLALFSLL